MMLASHQDYSDRTFKAEKLDHQTIRAAAFYDCSFTRCSFASASLIECRFVNCTFTNCDFSLAQLPGSQLSGARFEGCKLIGINWTEADWSGINLGEPLAFKGCALNHSTFLGLDLPGIQFSNCTVIGADFREANLSQGDFSGSDLLDSLFQHTNLTDVDLSKARNYTIAPMENTLKRARFAMPEALSLLYNLDIRLDDERSD